ncbi:MAG: ATP-binding protein, partial [Opitutales bacterium]
WFRSLPAYGTYGSLGLLTVYLGFRAYSAREKVRRSYLEQIVRRRTAELESANRVKAEFVASMSHELRNPMNGVIGLTELLSRERLPGELPKMVSTLRACSEQLSRMINDVLDFAKIEAGRLTLEKRPFNLAALIEQTLEVTSWDANQSAHLLRTDIAPGLPLLLVGDNTKISQILVNFLNNACKYAAPGEILLRCRHRPQGENRQWLRLAVEDSGPGLSEAERTQVFERFYRSPSASASAVRGSGLGLAVCAELAELMGGRLGVEANERGGSTFYLELALFLPEGAERATDPAEFETTYMGSALVVDDMDYNRLVAAGLLESLGFTVTSVASGADAVECLVATDYDFAFIDYELGDLTGPEVMRRAATGKADFRTRCFAVTAYSGEETQRACLAAGFRGVLSKPLSRVRLREALIGSGLHPADLATGAYQQPLQDSAHEAFDLEPLLLLCRGSMNRLMEKCEEYLAILHREVETTEGLLLDGQSDPEAISKRLHRLASHGSIVKAQRFIEQVEIVGQQVRAGAPLRHRENAANEINERYRELALNLRQVVAEYHSRG